MRSPLNKRLFRELRWRIWKISVHFYLDDADDWNGIRISGGRWKHDPGRTRKALRNITLKMDISGQKRK